MGSSSRLLGFESQPHHSLIVNLWAILLTELWFLYQQNNNIYHRGLLKRYIAIIHVKLLSECLEHRKHVENAT